MVTSMKRVRSKDTAVSPVVGIMLMLVVTLILAAIIGGMTGNMAQTQKKPPQLVIEAIMVNNGTLDENSFLDISVISVSEGIATRDLKIQTEWTSGSGASNRTMITGGIPNAGGRTYPRGYGPGVVNSTLSDFGEYTLVAGTRMHADASDDGLDAVLGSNWDTLQAGDTLRIQVIHIPGGAIIVDNEITVED